MLDNPLIPLDIVRLILSNEVLNAHDLLNIQLVSVFFARILDEQHFCANPWRVLSRRRYKILNDAEYALCDIRKMLSSREDVDFFHDMRIVQGDNIEYCAFLPVQFNILKIRSLIQQNDANNVFVLNGTRQRSHCVSFHSVQYSRVNSTVFYNGKIIITYLTILPVDYDRDVIQFENAFTLILKFITQSYAPYRRLRSLSIDGRLLP